MNAPQMDALAGFVRAVDEKIDALESDVAQTLTEVSMSFEAEGRVFTFDRHDGCFSLAGVEEA